MPIFIHSRKDKFVFTDVRRSKKWINSVIELHKRELGELQFIFCSDRQLLHINKKFLQHSYFTDVITFNYCEGSIIAGDIFISVDRVLYNAKHYNLTFKDELNRVMIHGVLHLIGFNDSSEIDKLKMTLQEDICLAMRIKDR